MAAEVLLHRLRSEVSRSHVPQSRERRSKTVNANRAIQSSARELGWKMPELNFTDTPFDKPMVLPLNGETFGVFAGKPRFFLGHWDSEKRKVVECDGNPEKCIICEAGVDRIFYFRINFVERDPAGNLKVRVFESGKRVWDILKELNELYGLSTMLVRVYRKADGTKQDRKRYYIDPMLDDNGVPMGRLNQESIELLNTFKLKAV